jgi:hypothetical protein
MNQGIFHNWLEYKFWNQNLYYSRVDRNVKLKPITKTAPLNAKIIPDNLKFILQGNHLVGISYASSQEAPKLQNNRRYFLSFAHFGIPFDKIQAIKHKMGMNLGLKGPQFS